MSVQDAVRTVTVPRQAAPADPPLTAAAPAAAPAVPLVGKDRPLTAEEREFMWSMVGVIGFLQLIIVTGLLVALTVWD